MTRKKSPSWVLVSRALVEAWAAWRASAMIPACVSCCSRQWKATKGGLLWGEDHFPALIDWKDVEVAYGLRQGIKYAQLVRR